jgi:hypothetical protein
MTVRQFFSICHHFQWGYMGYLRRSWSYSRRANQCLSPHELESRSWRGVLDTTLCDKKSLKIPKGSSESVNRRRTENTMAKRKSTKGQTTKYKTKYRVIRTPLKTGGDLIWSGRVSSSCSTSGTRRVNLVTNPVISHEWVEDREVLTTSGTHPWSFVTQIVYNGQPSNDGDFNFNYLVQ